MSIVTATVTRAGEKEVTLKLEPQISSAWPLVPAVLGLIPVALVACVQLNTPWEHFLVAWICASGVAVAGAAASALLEQQRIRCLRLVSEGALRAFVESRKPPPSPASPGSGTESR